MQEPFQPDDSFLPADPGATCRCAECGAEFQAGPGHYCTSPREAAHDGDRRYLLGILLIVIALVLA